MNVIDKLNTDEVKSFFVNKPEILAVYLFGSFAEGRQNYSSDLDLGILFLKEKKELIDYNYLARLQVELVKLLDFEDIDTVIVNDKEPVFLYNILTGGRLIYYIDTDEFTGFLYESISSYQDYLPVYAFWEEVYYGK